MGSLIRKVLAVIAVLVLAVAAGTTISNAARPNSQHMGMQSWSVVEEVMPHIRAFLNSR